MIRFTDPDADPPAAQAWAGGWPQTTEEFERLVEACQHRLVSYAFRRLGNRADAEDIAQEVFVRAYADRRKRTGVASVVAYLFRMAGNRCTDLLRRRGLARMVPLEETRILEIPSREPDGAQVAEAAEELWRIEGLLAQLPEPQAEAVRLCVLAELTVREAAQVLDCPEPTVKSRIRYGLEKLREIITREREEAR